MEIKNSHFVITGANRGIGRAVALELSADQPHYHLVQRKKDPELEAELMKAGARSVTFYETNLEKPEAIENLIKQLNEVPVDILFNNAGQLTGGLLENQPAQDILRMLQVNVNALIQLTHGLLPKMLERKKGKIINHGSVSSIMYLPCASTYSASKAAVYAFTKCLDSELKGSGVSTLILVTPGIDTEMFRDIPKLYGSNLNVNMLTSIPPKKYAQMIREAILEDLTELTPTGSTGIGLAMARHTPKLFNKIVGSQFSRSPKDSAKN
jgi:short-subunit dehydrogenase